MIGSVVSLITGGMSGGNSRKIDSKYISPGYEAVRSKLRKIFRTRSVGPMTFSGVQELGA